MAFLFSAGFLNALPVNGETKPAAVSEGKTLPAFKLSMPANPEIKQYLGVDGGSDFTLNQIRSKLILIEIFSAVCPGCLENAPRVNNLYNIISDDSDLKSTIVMLGIAVGNDEKLVDVYQKKYNVKFPLFPDPNGDIDKLLTDVATPTLILADNTGKILFVHGGLIEDMDHILTVIRTIRGN
jgi:peroxiredoxin